MNEKPFLTFLICFRSFGDAVIKCTEELQLVNELHVAVAVVGHRPMYCSSNNDPEHCEAVNNFARVGIPYREAYLFAPEELYYEQGVDLMFFGHEHNYERFWPVYNRRVCNGTDDPLNPYANPRAPVHFTTGAAVRTRAQQLICPLHSSCPLLL